MELVVVVVVAQICNSDKNKFSFKMLIVPVLVAEPEMRPQKEVP